MRGELRDKEVLIPFSQRIYGRKIGKKRGDCLVLSIEEAAYLALKGSIEIYSENKIADFDELFSLSDPIKFFVYEDLRERGVRIKIDDFQNYIPLHENFVFKVRDLKKFCGKKIAIVDSESDVSYFLIEKFDEIGRHKEVIKEFKARFANGFFVAENTELFRKYFYGTEKGNKVILSIFEALYLIEIGAMETNIKTDEIIKYGKSNIKDFEKKYLVYKDLRRRNFMVKTGFKFGSDFRVYDEIKSLSELTHSKHLVKVKSVIPAFELAGDVRLSAAVNKTVIYPVFKKKGGLEYVIVKRVKY